MCGALRKEELSYLFPDAGEVGSAALMPLGNGAQLGLIAVGSSDAGRYSSSMGTLFLAHIADVVVRLLPRLHPGRRDRRDRPRGLPLQNRAAPRSSNAAATALHHLPAGCAPAVPAYTAAITSETWPHCNHSASNMPRSLQQQLIEADIRQWVSQLHRRGLAGSSIQRSLSAARSFFNYLGRERGRPRNPAASVQAPRKPRKLPKTLDADQVDKYLIFDEDSRSPGATAPSPSCFIPRDCALRSWPPWTSTTLTTTRS